MPPAAKVSSIQALDDFKTSLILFREKAGHLLDEASGDVVRTRSWLQTDRLVHWKNQARQRARELAQAEQELLTARLSDMPEAIKARRMAVNKAKLALQEAEDGLARVKHWILHYETQVESHAKLVTQLRHSLAHDMIKAVAFLETAASILVAYAETSPPLHATDPESRPGSPPANREHRPQEPSPDSSGLANSPEANPCAFPSQEIPQASGCFTGGGPTPHSGLENSRPPGADESAGPPVPEGGAA